jgi:hypothetical protein
VSREPNAEHDESGQNHGPDLTPSPSAGRLADALRFSVSTRRRLAAEDEDEDAARFRALGDLEGVPPVAKPGIAAPAIRKLRGALRTLLRPWLAVQSTFNREVATRFQVMGTAVRELERQTPQLEVAISRLDERLREIEAARRTAPEPVSAADGLDVAWLERTFVHSRLPRPPSRVLAIGPAADAIAGELVSFGFDVVAAGTYAGEHPSSRPRCVRTSVGALPFRDAIFDVVVWLNGRGGDVLVDSELERLVREIARVLKQGGRLLLSRPRDRDALSPKLVPLQAVEELVAAHDGVVWSVGEPAPVRAAGPLGGRAADCMLVDARRPDAPGR